MQLPSSERIAHSEASQVLNISKDGNPAASLGNLFPYSSQ